MTTGNLVKHGFPSPQDMCLPPDSNRNFLPGMGEGGDATNSQNSLAPKPNVRELLKHQLNNFV